jgi:hypothetical protein
MTIHLEPLFWWVALSDAVVVFSLSFLYILLQYGWIFWGKIIKDEGAFQFEFYFNQLGPKIKKCGTIWWNILIFWGNIIKDERVFQFEFYCNQIGPKIKKLEWKNKNSIISSIIYFGPHKYKFSDIFSKTQKQKLLFLVTAWLMNVANQ